MRCITGWWKDSIESSMTIAHYIDSTGTNWELYTYVNTLVEENVRVEHTPTTVLVGHLVDSDVVYSCFETQRAWWPK